MKHLKRYWALLPIIYLFVAVFLARSKVQYVYLSAALLILLTLATQAKSKIKSNIFLAQWLAVLAVIGISCATILTIEKIELLSHPDRIASCSLSPIVACSPVIASNQASAFGFANSLIGLFGFTAVFTAAMTILAGASKLTKAWWRTLLGGIFFGALFCTWLIHEGMFDIGKLCLYCMLVWLVTFAMLWLTTAYCIDNKYINLGGKLNKLLSYKYELIAVTYTIIFLLIFYRWSDYWLSLI